MGDLWVVRMLDFRLTRMGDHRGRWLVERCPLTGGDAAIHPSAPTARVRQSVTWVRNPRDCLLLPRTSSAAHIEELAVPLSSCEVVLYGVFLLEAVQQAGACDEQ